MIAVGVLYLSKTKMQTPTVCKNLNQIVECEQPIWIGDYLQYIIGLQLLFFCCIDKKKAVCSAQAIVWFSLLS